MNRGAKIKLTALGLKSSKQSIRKLVDKEIKRLRDSISSGNTAATQGVDNPS